MYLGKQSSEFKSEFARSLPSSQCFSLMTDKENGLHLIASDDQSRADTLATIKGFWDLKKKKTTTPAATASAPAKKTTMAMCQTLDLQMDSEVERDMWIRCVRAIFAAKPVGKIGSTAGQHTNRRKLTALSTQRAVRSR